MRNFWITSKIDGRKSELSGGPKANSGKMITEIRQNVQGESKIVFTIKCYANGDGSLTTEIYNAMGHKITDYTAVK